MSSESFYRAFPGHVLLERDGLRSLVPQGWDCRIGRIADTEADEGVFPVLHASTIPLPANRADYGGGVVERLGRGDVFVALIEFGPDEARTSLFVETAQMPVLEGSQFKRNQLQRAIRGQAGVQHFFTLNDRPFCLYVVLGSIARLEESVARANDLVGGLAVEVR